MRGRAIFLLFIFTSFTVLATVNTVFIGNNNLSLVSAQNLPEEEHQHGGEHGTKGKMECSIGVLALDLINFENRLENIFKELSLLYEHRTGEIIIPPPELLLV